MSNPTYGRVRGRGIEVKITGVNEALAELQRLGKKYPQAAMRALTRQANFVMTESKFRYCPVKDGHLRASGHVQPDLTKKQVVMGYGGPAGIGNVQGQTNRRDVGYAVVQHETESYRHTVGESGYLRKPLQRKLTTMGKEAADEVRADVLSGRTR